MTRNIKRWIYLAFSLAVTVGVFSYLLKYVSVGEVLDLIRHADGRGILMFLVLSLGGSLFRLWRYLVLLRLSGYAPGPVALFLVVLVRNFFSDLLPARLGTLIFIYLANSRLGVPLPAATATFSLSFVFDLIALAPLILAAALGVGAAGRISPAALVAGGGVLAAATVAVLYLLPWMFRWSGRLVEWTPFLSPELRRKLDQGLASVGDEIRKAKEGGVYLRVLVLSLLVRLAKYGSLYVFLFALLAPRGYDWGQLSIPRVFIGLCASELAASTPVSGIAAFGAYEGTWAAVFSILGFPGDIAKLTSISHHLFTQVYGYLLGAVALLVLLLPVFRVVDASAPPSAGRDRPWVFYGKVAVAVGVAALILYGLA